MSSPTVRTTKLGVACAAFVLALAIAATVEARCRPVNGHFEEHAVPCDTLCTQGTLIGGVQGAYAFVLTGLFGSVNQGVSHFTGNSVIATRQGDLILRETGAFRDATGQLVDLMLIVGGTDRLAGATGHLSLVATFDGFIGVGEYRGEVCTP